MLSWSFSSTVVVAFMSAVPVIFNLALTLATLVLVVVLHCLHVSIHGISFLLFEKF